MVSVRQQVFEFLKKHPDISLKQLKKEFKDCPTNTIRTYYRQHADISKNVSINIKQELIKIIKNYKSPASARVQAIREYNNLVENKEQEESSDDGFLKWLETQGNSTLTNRSITDTSSHTSTSPIPGKNGNKSTKTKSSA